MVTVAVAITVLAIGIPLFDSMVANNRAVTQSNSLVTALNLARNEAVSKNITSTICADADTDPATFVCGITSDYDWANGWFVFNDEDGDGIRDNTEPVIKLWESLGPEADVVTTVPFVRFNSLGEKIGTALISFRLAQVDNNDEIASSSQPRCVYLNAIGQLRTGRAETSGGDPVRIGDEASDIVCP